MIGSLTLERALPWALLVLVVGALSGFGFGALIGDDGGSKGATGDLAAIDGPAGTGTSTTGPSGSTVPSTTAPLACVGKPAPGTQTYGLVAGIADYGGTPLAAAVRSERPALHTFAEVKSSEVDIGRFLREIRAAEVDKAVLLVVRVTDGPLQVDLAKQVVADFPGSTVVAVNDGAGAPPQDLANRYPPGTIAVPDQGADGVRLSTAWANQVARIITNKAPCGQN